MNETAINEQRPRRDALEGILFEFVSRVAQKENATPEELTALPGVAQALVRSLELTLEP